MAKPVRYVLKVLSQEVLFRTHQTWLLPISICHVLSGQRFGSYEDVKKWLDEWFAVEGEDFYWRGIYKLSKN